MRCLTLADALRGNGADVLFVCRDHPSNMCDLIEARGYAVSRLPISAKPLENECTYGSWLGAGWREDAAETAAAILRHWREMADWLIVDHYAIDSNWEAALRSHSHRIMAIDDLANRSHDCDLLLDQNLVEDFEDRYQGLVPETCVCLLGPRFALLAPEYAELHMKMRLRQGPVRNIFVFFGGADRFGLAEKVVHAFLSLNRPDVRLDVVVGRLTPSLPNVRALAEGCGNVVVHSNLPSLAPLMAEADLAIGAAGATSWERLCLGLPAIVVTLAENQRPIAAELDRRGLVDWIGDGGRLDVGDFRNAILAHSTIPPNSISAFQEAQVDGLGAGRVAAALCVDKKTNLTVRRARKTDEGVLFSWANDAETRRNSFDGRKIELPEHRSWFRSRLQDGDCRFYLVEACGVAIAQVRFERQGLLWMISYSLSPIFRGRGLAVGCLRMAISELAAEERKVALLASVKPSNIASRNVFERLGFAIVTESIDSIEYRHVVAA